MIAVLLYVSSLQNDRYMALNAITGHPYYLPFKNYIILNDHLFCLLVVGLRETYSFILSLRTYFCYLILAELRMMLWISE